MTVVGKILVFLNLVFSLVVGGFAVVDYTARTHWAKAFDDVKAQNDKLRGMAESYKKDSDRLGSEKADLYKKLVDQAPLIDPALKDAPDAGARIALNALTELEARRKTIVDLSDTIKLLREERAKSIQKVNEYKNMEMAFNKDIERRVKDTEIMRGTLRVEMDKNFKLEQEKNQMREDMVTAQIAAKTLKDRNTQMETLLQDAMRNVAQAKANLGATGVASKGANPPSENIEGQVSRVDGNLVSITVGGDNGLAKNQTMEVFRLGTNPRYIGRVRLVDVAAKSSVGQFVGRPTMTIQVGDKVASRILGGY